MNKKTILKTLGLIIALSIMFPVGLNCLLSRERIGNVAIVGEGKDWLSFYGSYIGGVATALISFAILLFTIEHNRKTLRITFQEEALTRLKHDLAVRISQLNFNRIGLVALVLNDAERCKEENLRIDDFHQQLTRDYNAFRLIYENSAEKCVIHFMEAYTLCVMQLFQDIAEMTELLAKLPPHVPSTRVKAMQEAVGAYNSKYRSIWETPSKDLIMKIADYQYSLKSVEVREKTIRKINELIQATGEHKQNCMPLVFAAARAWIKAEQEKLDALYS